MAMVSAVYLWLKPIGLVQRSAATWRCDAFISWTGWTLAMFHQVDSTIKIILVIIITVWFTTWTVHHKWFTKEQTAWTESYLEAFNSPVVWIKHETCKGTRLCCAVPTIRAVYQYSHALMHRLNITSTQPPSHNHKTEKQCRRRWQVIPFTLLRRPLLLYGYIYKASCARVG